ncbi:hypothetical protein GGQ74_001160 [Desulfobaculum xiamenense]|uniref:Uncharacterized protein n=1 Tax=Desulfobaculum xiamenense TaxID=995050 RepID=A0A846QKD6_9BACT|nr:hypothetical protein [Desulfobaculum xiamenense]NJB67520.1 hypothetical protein [Desulfobaculum xiamenense]
MSDGMGHLDAVGISGSTLGCAARELEAAQLLAQCLRQFRALRMLALDGAASNTVVFSIASDALDALRAAGVGDE